MPESVYRYAVCGCSNMVFDWILYFVFYNFIIQKQIVNLYFVSLSPHIAALIFTFPITLASGFYLSHYISFSGSSLRRRTQAFRYIVIVAANLGINYVCLKLFVDVCHIYPTPAKIMTTVFTTIFSFFAQKHYSFKKTKA